MKKNYEDMTDKQKEAHDKWMARSKKLEATGKSMQKAGGAMMGCGCLLTLFITIPILIFIVWLLF